MLVYYRKKGNAAKITKAEKKYGKLIENDKGRIWVKMINGFYGVFMIVKDFSFKILWFGSCVGLMFIFPMSFEMYND